MDDPDWHHSQWERRHIIQAATDKIHQIRNSFGIAPLAAKSAYAQ